LVQILLIVLHRWYLPNPSGVQASSVALNQEHFLLDQAASASDRACLSIFGLLQVLAECLAFSALLWQVQIPLFKTDGLSHAQELFAKPWHWPC